MRKVRFGIVGIGNMGTAHSKSLLEGKIANGELCAICEPKQAKADAILSLNGAESVVSFADYTEMLHSGLIDAVIVAVPPYDHQALVCQALEAGLHVICEKPVTVSSEELLEVTAVAQ